LLKSCKTRAREFQPELFEKHVYVRIFNSTKVVIFSRIKENTRVVLNSSTKQQATSVINFKRVDFNPFLKD